MKYYIIAGEASGDLHGSNLMKGLLKADPQAEFRFWGGDKMAAVGGPENLVHHYKEASFMGFWEVLKNLRTISAQMKECRTDVEAYAPDVLILIDYAGFNLRMARFAHHKGIKCFYYIAPKVWAWKESRVKRLRRYVDKLFVIFPFEVDYFRIHGIEAIYEGNPIMDVIPEGAREAADRERFAEENGLDGRPVIALLAGSRANEIHHNLPFMAEVAARFPDHQFVVGGVSWLEKSLYEEVLQGTGMAMVYDKTYELLAVAEAAVVTSGTATLETALIGTPEVVCYKTSRLSMLIGQIFIKVRFISLVNLVMDREVVKELYLAQMNPDEAEKQLRRILPGGRGRDKMLANYHRLSEMIGGSGASDRFAARMVGLLK